MPLLSAARKAAALTQPLPVDNEYLSRHGVAMRRGQFSILAAAPGVGKSLLASNITARTSVPTLFLSADSDEYTVKTRVAGILTGAKLEDVDRQMSEGGKAEEWYAERLRLVDHVDWCYRTDIDIEFIVRRLLAHVELRGENPHLIVVDNLTNTVSDPENEYGELRSICRELQAIARTTGAHVLALHHVKGPKESGFQPIGQGDLLGNLAKLPELVIGLNRIEGDPAHLNMTIPKNRAGKAGINIHIPVDYSSAYIGGWKVAA